MSKLVGSRGIVLSLPWILFSCSSHEEAARVGESRAALAGTSAVADSATLEARAVVRLTDGTGHCTGTLVTPLLVLTARHCVAGTVGQSKPPTWGLRPPFELWDGANHVTTITTLRDAIMPNANLVDPSSVADLATDVALVPVNPALLNRTGWDALLQTRSIRPPNPALSVTLDGSGVATYSVPFQIAGFGLSSTRNIASESRLQTGSGMWDLLYPFDPSLNLEGGDSGGPVFVVRSTNGPREVIGVHSAVTSDGGHRYFADVTSATNSAWLASAAVDHDHDGARFTRWRAMHPSASTRWFGEVDYLGACDVSRDRDCDHWDDAHDNCAYTYNPDQAYRDDDGAGDACGGCPCDPDTDLDQDGVCAVLCSWQQPYAVADNCPRVYNPTQDNCNAASEIAAQQRGENVASLGDACDPVPCPNVDPVTSPGQGFQGTCSGNATIGYNCTGRKVRNGMALTYRGPRPMSAKQVGPSVLSDTFSAGDVVTSARFCQSNKTIGFDCSDPSFAMRDARLTDPENTSTRYRQVSFSVGGINAARGTTWTARYPGGPVSERWDYTADNAYWSSAGLLIAPGNYPNCSTWSWAGTCLDGVFWTHAASPIGADLLHSRDANGNVVGVHGVELANHHQPLRPDEPTHFIINGVGDYHPVMPWVKFSDPYETGNLTESRLLAIHAAFDDHVFVFQHDATALDVTGLVSTNASKILGSPGVYFASAVEPDRRLGTSTNVEAMLLPTGGNRITELLVTDNGTLKSGTEAGLFPFLYSYVTPPSRTGGVAVYSRVAGGLFVLGGKNATTGVQYQDLWFIRLGRTWGQIPLSGYSAAGGVLAATYSFADQKLWVVALSGASTATVYRIDATSGVATSAGTFSYTGAYVRHGFSLDHDGSVLLFAKASSGAAKLAKLTIDSSGHVAASKIDRDEPGLNRAPLVDENGYSLVHDDYTTERLTSLRGLTGAFSLAEMF